jgi:hypothetical protein
MIKIFAPLTPARVGSSAPEIARSIKTRIKTIRKESSTVQTPITVRETTAPETNADIVLRNIRSQYGVTEPERPEQIYYGGGGLQFQGIQLPENVTGIFSTPQIAPVGVGGFFSNIGRIPAAIIGGGIGLLAGMLLGGGQEQQVTQQPTIIPTVTPTVTPTITPTITPDITPVTYQAPYIGLGGGSVGGGIIGSQSITETYAPITTTSIQETITKTITPTYSYVGAALEQKQDQSMIMLLLLGLGALALGLGGK